MYYLYQFIYNILVGIWGVLPVHDLGLAIILATIVVRLAMWPVDKKGLRGRQALQSLQPEIVKIKEKAKGDKQAESKMIMELYKEKEVNPVSSSCLPLLVQFPFLIGLFQVFMYWLKPEFLADRTYAFVRSLPYVKQAIADPALFNATLFGIDLSALGKAGLVFALFPIAAAALQYYQVKMLSPQQNLDDQQKMMAKLNFLGPVMILFFGFTFPIAMSLYWAAMSLVAILQQHLIMKKDVEVLEETSVNQKVEKKKDKKKKKRKK
ncbi:MAG: 60 kDa inner membrane insertion protein [candidate division CPR2 bacterium GW2011_GWC1_41_48]|uniref:60 kDa inner membrane insertion protein n=1 Tax=candidate division CPR2 bacterium GW2011_GWC1_41_48 TaxID=1618344 RepID=A0A0G0Z8Q1_UNCC2|nr:MAG: 60 kDa inner membrane insertion protein [candidate division CPR2 bacterium GW2011_GWC2_39_35]KKR27969.1 MAG: 60 kDa inner membrane insertion protein [candidate division CPR2 bacterium GW2011_GWD2_39_7]KKS09428.1 MAG: 60 kDa inner membrane insertion protein [candidate division CPR2 bacterium GW2011_GWC1_41_48]OGB72077.1 MAG: hypothetical protein A2Y26_01955 [candidate division CPR2 bacterium GWD2_39_7]